MIISDLRVWVHLGCREEEKYHPQCVSFKIELTFKSLPKAILTDKLEDTVCYLACVQNIERLCHSRSFNLIEHLTAEIHKEIARTLGDKRKDISELTVILCKMAPPVPSVHGGVSFTYCDDPSRKDPA